MNYRYLLVLLFITSSKLIAQTIVSIETGTIELSDIKMNFLNDPNLKGSEVYGDDSFGSYTSLNAISYIGSKIALKVGVGWGYFTKGIIFYASPEFINYTEFPIYDRRDLIIGNLNFTELKFGGNLPLEIRERNNINITLSGKLTQVLGENQFINRDLRAFNNYGVNIDTVLFEGEAEINNGDQMQMGVDIGIQYEYILKNTPLHLQIGAHASYGFQSYLSGQFVFTGKDDFLIAEMEQRISYYGARFGIAYTFSPLSY